MGFNKIVGNLFGISPEEKEIREGHGFGFGFGFGFGGGCMMVGTAIVDPPLSKPSWIKFENKIKSINQKPTHHHSHHKILGF